MWWQVNISKPEQGDESERNRSRKITRKSVLKQTWGTGSVQGQQNRCKDNVVSRTKPDWGHSKG